MYSPQRLWKLFGEHAGGGRGRRRRRRRRSLDSIKNSIKNARHNFGAATQKWNYSNQLWRLSPGLPVHEACRKYVLVSSRGDEVQDRIVETMAEATSQLKLLKHHLWGVTLWGPGFVMRESGQLCSIRVQHCGTLTKLDDTLLLLERIDGLFYHGDPCKENQFYIYIYIYIRRPSFCATCEWTRTWQLATSTRTVFRWASATTFPATGA